VSGAATAPDAPVLSICVPTWNRAALLDDLVRTIEPDLEVAAPAVELVIADNASTDDTEAVMRARLGSSPHVRYERRPENIGPARNVWGLVEQLARGEYCWVVGDDDLVFRGALQEVLERLARDPALDYAYLNYAVVDLERRHAITNSGCPYIPHDDECFVHDRSDRVLPRWEDLLMGDSWLPIGVYISLLPHVFRRSAWLQHADLIDRSHGTGPVSFDLLFPLLRSLATMMVGKPTVYVGEPLVAQGAWHQDWGDHYSAAMIAAFDEQLWLFERLGVDRRILDPLRRELVTSRAVRRRVPELLAEPGTPGRDAFSLVRFVSRNRRHPRALLGIGLETGRAFARRARRWLRACVDARLTNVSGRAHGAPRRGAGEGDR
jgi:hypothetical protein